MPVRLTARKDWSRRAQARSADIDEALIAAGRKAYAALPAAERLELCRDIVATRRRELSLAHDNVVMVTAGFKECRVPGTRRRRYTRTPCVIFVVRSKWSRRPRAGHPRALPRELAASWWSAGERVTCAVPTDVVTERRFFDAELQAMSGIRVQRPGTGASFIGNIACAVRVTVDGQRRDMMLSCLHVLSPIPAADRGPPYAGAAVRRANPGSAPPFGASAPIGGVIRSDGAPSFDVQLAEVSDRAALRLALDGLSLSARAPYVPSRDDFDRLVLAGARLRILVSPYNTDTGQPESGRVAYARYAHDHPDADGWDCEAMVGGVRKTIVIYQRRLIDLRFVRGRAVAGDSGSPVVVMAADGGYTLAGMHLAGSDTHSVMLPAWQLFQPRLYGARVSSIRPVDA